MVTALDAHSRASSGNATGTSGRHRSGRRKKEPAASSLRLEIQAARAIAIASVVIYHFWPSRLPGGFVGVDIFFAISGYLITGHIAKPVSEGRFTFRAFYARRAWRLLPASMSALAASVLLTFFFVPQTLWRDFGEQIAASALYVENWKLAADSVDYSALAANSSIVQHFWSLSTEEQFYAVWPLILWLCAVVARRGRHLHRTFGVALSVVFVASLAYSIYETTQSPAAYFITTTRAWEFAAGGLLWLVLRKVTLPRAVAAGASWLGIVIVAVTLVTFDAATPFPSGTALLPIVGILLIIAGGMPGVAWSPEFVFRLRPVQWLGDISYSLYLWHWPLLIVAPFVLGFAGGDVLPGRWKVAVIVVAVVVAHLSRRFIEKPLIAFSSARMRVPRPRFRGILVFGIAGMLVVALPAAGLAGTAIAAQNQTTKASDVVSTSQGVLRAKACVGAAAMTRGASCPTVPEDKVVPTLVQTATDDFNDRAGAGCQSQDATLKTCTVGDTKSTTRIALVGDSHAMNYAPAFQLMADANHWKLTTYLHSGCPLTTASIAAPTCNTWKASALAALKKAKYDVVFVAAMSRSPFPTPTLKTATDLTTANRDTAAAAYAAAWTQLQAVGSKVVALRDNPDPGLGGIPDITTCLATKGTGSECDFSQKAGLVDDAVAYAASVTPGVSLVDSTDYYCANGTCPAVIGGVIVYRQTQHVTQTFMESLAPYLDKKVAPLVATAVAAR